MNKRESIKYHKQHRGKHDVGGMADYVKGGFYSPIFEGATIRTIKYGNRDKVISDLERYGEYTNRELLMQNFAIGDNCSEMWVYELVDAIFDYFGEQRRMSVGDFINLCDEFSTYMGDDAGYEIAYFDDFQDEFDLAENEAVFFVEYVGRDGELVDATFIVGFKGVGEELAF